MQSKQDCCILPREGAGFVYKVTSPSGKAYIGQTVQSVATRFQWHCYKGSACRALKRAIGKYGADAMHVETLMEVPVDMLNHYEMRAIAMWGTYGRGGYNMTPGGDTSPMTCPEVAARARATLMQPDNHARFVESQQRSHATAHWRNAVSTAMKKAHAKPEVHAKYKAGWKRAQSKPEARQKQRVAQRKAHQDPDIHKRRMAGLERIRNDPVVQARRAASIRAAHERRRACLNNGTMTSEIRPGSQYAASWAGEVPQGDCQSPSLRRLRALAANSPPER